jgi:hypothetical protein
MRLVFLCVVAWLVLALAAFASGGIHHGSGSGGGSAGMVAR